MTISPMLSQVTEHPSTRPVQVNVYNLAVLVHHDGDGRTKARAANLLLPSVEATTIRDALSRIVRDAKALIAEHIAREVQIPWIDPPVEPSELESRFMVPLHL